MLNVECQTIVFDDVCKHKTTVRNVLKVKTNNFVNSFTIKNVAVLNFRAVTVNLLWGWQKAKDWKQVEKLMIYSQKDGNIFCERSVFLCGRNYENFVVLVNSKNSIFFNELIFVAYSKLQKPFPYPSCK